MATEHTDNRSLQDEAPESLGTYLLAPDQQLQTAAFPQRGCGAGNVTEI